MKLAKKVLAFAAVLAALAVGGTAAAAAAPPVLVPPASIEQMPAQSAGTAAANCNGATRFWYVYPTTTVVLPTVNGNRDCILGPGNQGTGVYWLQAALINCHRLSTGGHDSVYGPSTQAAVRAVQSAAGIAQDGIYGPNTRRVISWPVFRASDGAWIGCGRVT